MFLGFLNAGPDPNTMTCEKIIKGYEQNAYAAQYRSGATHKANAAARVQELEPFYKKCKGSQTVTSDQPAVIPDTQIYPGDLVPGGGQSELRRTGYSPGGAPTMSLDWQKIAMIVGGGVVLVLALKMLAKKRKGAAAGTSKTVSSAASVGMGGGI